MKDDAKFIEDHRALVEGIAQRIRAQLGLSCELEELIAWGFHGLVEARARFDGTRGVQFKTFAYYRIRGAILDGVRKMAWLSRRAHAKVRAADAVDDTLASVADERGANPASRRDQEQTVRSMDGALGRITAAYTLAALGQDEDHTEDSPETAFLSAEARRRVGEVLGRLPDRERALVEGFYFQGRRFDEVAEELGISKSWASRLHTKALERLRGFLEER